MDSQTICVVVATIAAGASLSDTITTGGLMPCSLQMPAAWDAADVSFQAAADAPAYVADVYNDDGAEHSIKAAASQFVNLDPTQLLGARYLKIRSGTASNPVAQSAERKVTLALKLN